MNIIIVSLIATTLIMLGCLAILAIIIFKDISKDKHPFDDPNGTL